MAYEEFLLCKILAKNEKGVGGKPQSTQQRFNGTSQQLREREVLTLKCWLADQGFPSTHRSFCVVKDAIYHILKNEVCNVRECSQ